MPAVNPPFIPRFGAGAPAGTAPRGTIYYDTTTNPYTSYAFNAGAWHLAGASSGLILGAGAPAGIAASGTLYSQTDAAALWSFQAAAVAASVVQTADTNGHGTPGAPTFGGAPTVGNILIAFLGSDGDASGSIDTTKWTVITHGGTSTGRGLAAYRYVQGGDTATPPAICSSGNFFWGLSVVEVTGVIGVFGTDVAGFTETYDHQAVWNTPSHVVSTNQMALLGAGAYDATANFTNPATWTVLDNWLHSSNYGAQNILSLAPANGTDVSAAFNFPASSENNFGITIIFAQASSENWLELAHNP